MRYPDQHLSADELESLGREKRLSSGLREDLGAARDHVQSCPACRRRLEVYLTTGAKLEKLRAPRKAPKGPDCPTIDTWLRLAGHLLPSAEQGRCVAHAAQCDHCGPILREIVHDFSHSPTEEEETLLSGIASSKEPWRRDLQPAPGPRPWSGFWRWGVPSVAVAACAVLAFVLIQANFFNLGDTLASVTQLLDKAFAERRITDMRIPGGKYGSVQVSKSGSPQSNTSPALLKARGLIAEALEKRPNNPEFLRRKAEADLLVGDYQDAIATLNTIVNQGNQSSAVLQDLGSAYFESAEDSSSGESRKIDYEKAFEYFSQALKIAPENSEILFNRAIVDERLQLLDQAIADWNQFLKLEHDQQWIAEGTKHLQAIEEKKKLAQ